MNPAQFSFSPAQPQQAQQNPLQQEGPKLGSKVQSKSGPRPSDEMNQCATALANSILAIGTSFSNPAKPSAVPKRAPNLDDWKMLHERLIKIIGPSFEKLEKERKKLIAERHKSHKPKSQRSKEGALVYLNAPFTRLLNVSGVLEGAEERNEAGELVRPAKRYVLPNHEDLLITKRPSIVSMVSALVHKFNLLHPTETSYFHVDHPLMAQFFTPEVVKRIGESIPQSQTEEGKKKKMEKCKKEGKEYKPTEPKARVKMMPKIDYSTGHPVEPQVMIPWILKGAIISIQDEFILHTRPRNLTEQEMDQIKEVGAYFTHLTEVRNALLAAQKKAAKKEEKKVEVARNIAAPSTVNFQTLNVNSNFNPVAVNKEGQVTFSPGAAAPAPAQATSNFPEGFSAQPGVSFTPN